MDVGAPLIADGEAAEAREPGERALYHPAVLSQLFVGLHSAPSNAGLDGAGATFRSAPPVVVGLVGVKFAGSLPGPTPPASNAWHGVQGGRQHHAVVAVSRAQANPQGCAPPVDHKVALRARFAAIRRVRACLGTPLLAGTDALSRQARLQSSCSASAKRSRSTR